MAGKEGFSRFARFGLGAALILAVGSVGYRLYSGRTASSVEALADNAENAGDSLDRLEARTRDNPEDVSAWQTLGWAYFDAQRYADAATAYRRAVALSDNSAILWSSLGEALVMASERDPMPAEALDAFRKAHERDAADPRARYFLAVAKDLTGDHEGAIADWLALLGDTPPGAPWEQDLRRTIDQVGKINKIETAQRMAAVKQPAASTAGQGQMPTVAQAIPGPSRAQMQAASGMSPGEQRAMAEGMVSQLETKLKSDPGNVERWVMLIRSRIALGQPDKARAALADAVKANPAAAQTLREQAALLGVR